MQTIEFFHVCPFVRKMVPDIICVVLLLCRIYLGISVNDDVAQRFFPQNFTVYIRNAFALRFDSVIF